MLKNLISQQNKNSTINIIIGIFIWLIACFYFCYEFAIRTLVGTLVNQIVPSLSISTTQFTLLNTTYYICFAIMQIPTGILTDKFGIKPPMCIGAILCGVGTILLAHATNFYIALLARSMMGLGSSFAFICLLIVASSWFPAKNFGFICGISQFVGTLGPMLASGILVPHAIASHQSWRSILTKFGLVGLAIAFLTGIFVHKGPYAKQTNNQKQHKEKIRFKKLLANKQIIWIILFTASNYCSISLFTETWGVRFLETKGFTQTLANHDIAIAWLGYAIGCPLLGFISDTIGKRKGIMLFSSILGLIVVITTIYTPAHHMIPILLFGLGVAASGQSLGYVVISEKSPNNLKATALGLNNSTLTVFNLTFPSIIALIIMLSFGNINPMQLTYHQLSNVLITLPILFTISIFMAKKIKA